ncbi:cytochrome c maturation protein CcmE domain-containing protein [Nitrospira sp. M1]
MTGFYLRWAGVIVMAILLTVLATRNYQENLASVSPAAVIAGEHSQAPIRVQGMVGSGSLTGSPEEGHAEFALLGETKNLKVQYQGPPLENLRELKTLILIGRWDPEAQMFQAKETALVTNYGFVASAYLIAFVVLVASVFSMSRKVTCLFQEIKESKLYEPEFETHVDQR